MVIETVAQAIGKFIFEAAMSGAIGNLAYDVIKRWWLDSTGKSLDETYLEAFIQAVEQSKLWLKQHSDKDAEIIVHQKSFLVVLRQKAGITLVPENRETFLRDLARLLAEHHILEIPGHDFHPDDYEGVVLQTLRVAWNKIYATITEKEELFRQFVKQNTEQQAVQLEGILEIVQRIQMGLPSILDSHLTQLTARMDLRFDDMSKGLQELREGQSELLERTSPRPVPDPLYLDAYVRGLRDRTQRLLLRDRPCHNADQFVAIPLMVKPRDGDKESLPVTALPKLHYRFVLVGEGGSGKTTSLREMTLLAANAYLAGNNEAKLPVCLDLNKSTRDILSLIENVLAPAYIDSETLKQYIREGSLFFFIDGLNEAPKAIRDASIRELAQLMGMSEQNRFAITTRPLGYGEGLDAPIFDLQSLGKDQIVEYVNTCLDRNTNAQDFLKQMGVNDPLQWDNPRSLVTLARNPMMLSWMVELGEIPPNRGRLIEKLMEKRLGKWEEALGRRGNFSYPEKAAVLARLAFQMMKERETTTYAQWEDAEEVFTECRGPKHGREMFQEVIRNGILRLSGRGVVWMHQLIQEFFSALALEDLLKDGASLENYTRNSEWHEVLVLLAGLSKKPEQVVEAVMIANPFLGARCYCATESLSNKVDLRKYLVDMMIKNRLSLWTLTGDAHSIEEMVKEEKKYRTDIGAYQLLAGLLENQGKLNEALAVLQEGASKSRMTPAEQFELICKVGEFDRRQGKHAIALRLFQEAEKLASRTGYHDRDDWLYYELAYIHLKEGRIREALNYCNKSFKAGLHMSNPGRAYIGMALAGGLLAQSGRYYLARHLLERSLSVFKAEQEKNARWIPNIIYHLLEVYTGLHEFNKAEKMIDEACTILSASKANPALQVMHLFRIGRCRLAQNMYQDALAKLAEALEQSKKVTDLSLERMAEILHDAGQAHLGLGHMEEARNCFSQSITQPAHLNNLWGRAQSLLALGQLSLETGFTAEAQQHLQRSAELLRQLHSSRLTLARDALNRAYSKQV